MSHRGIKGIISAKIRLATARFCSFPLRRKNNIVAFDLPSKGELQFLKPVLGKYIDDNPDDIIVIIHHGDTEQFIINEMSASRSTFIHLDNSIIRSVSFKEIDIFITTEQYRLGLDGVYSISLFHGQPSKGLTFTKNIVDSFDAFFLYGPLHLEALDEFVREQFSNFPQHLKLFKVGYPKSDFLLNNGYQNLDLLRNEGFDPARPTILFAPAFNEGASLRENGLAIIETLAGKIHWNVLVKLPIDCWAPTSNFYATGGINWFHAIKELQERYTNLKLYSEYAIDPLLACADVLITCVSSVSFEFLALNKPVVFIDTPKFFSEYLKEYFPDKDTVAWADRTTVNGGKDFGPVVTEIEKLPEMIENVLAFPQKYPLQQEKLQDYLLYNHGTATKVAVEKIEELLAVGISTFRPQKTHGLFRTCLSRVSTLLSGVPEKLLRKCKELILRILNKKGYTLERSGGGYYEPEKLIQDAVNAELPICNYLESLEPDTRKVGRRDRIINRLDNYHVFDSCESVLEIGTGTGMYLERILEKANPKRYEVYETHPGWCKYLKTHYPSTESCVMVVHVPDGETLKDTSSSSCMLVHAHAVFVYISLLRILSYLRDACRVLVPGGLLVFDCFLDTNFHKTEVDSWLKGEYRFPVIVPEKLLLDCLDSEGVRLQHKFNEIYGDSSVDYLIFKKDSI